jgi:hypothetical protein
VLPVALLLAVLLQAKALEALLPQAMQVMREFAAMAVQALLPWEQALPLSQQALPPLALVLLLASSLEALPRQGSPSPSPQALPPEAQRAAQPPASAAA